jgi:hypothetical protein
MVLDPPELGVLDRPFLPAVEVLGVTLSTSRRA